MTDDGKYVVGMIGSDGTRVDFDWHQIALEKQEIIERLQDHIKILQSQFDESHRQFMALSELWATKK